MNMIVDRSFDDMVDPNKLNDSQDNDFDMELIHIWYWIYLNRRRIGLVFYLEGSGEIVINRWSRGSQFYNFGIYDPNGILDSRYQGIAVCPHKLRKRLSINEHQYKPGQILKNWYERDYLYTDDIGISDISNAKNESLLKSNDYTIEIGMPSRNKNKPNTQKRYIFISKKALELVVGNFYILPEER